MERSRLERRAAPRSLLTISAGFAAATGIAILWVDAPVARSLADHDVWEIWRRGERGLEWLLLLPIAPWAVSVALVVGMVVAVAFPAVRGSAPAWMLIAGVHLAARVSTNWMKDATARIRPATWLERGGDATFWQDGNAFPSGHVALFAGVIVPLAVVVPRARPLLVIVGLVALTRVAQNQHFISDTLAAISWVAAWTWAIGWLVRPRRR